MRKRKAAQLTGGEGRRACIPISPFLSRVTARCSPRGPHHTLLSLSSLPLFHPKVLPIPFLLFSSTSQTSHHQTPMAPLIYSNTSSLRSLSSWLHYPLSLTSSSLSLSSLYGLQEWRRRRRSQDELEGCRSVLVGGLLQHPQALRQIEGFSHRTPTQQGRRRRLVCFVLFSTEICCNGDDVEWDLVFFTFFFPFFCLSLLE